MEEILINLRLKVPSYQALIYDDDKNTNKIKKEIHENNRRRPCVLK